MKKQFLVWLFFFIIVLFFYKGAFKSYFEGDEWYYFLKFLPLTHHPFGFLESVVLSFTKSEEISGGGHVAPIYSSIWYLFNYFFGLNFAPYIWASLLIHSTNSFLITIFVKSITRNKINAVLSGIFFAITAVHYQAITWVMAVVPTQISLLFSLFGVMLWIFWRKNKSKRTLVASVAFFIAALLTKETAIVFVVLAPILFISFKNKNLLKSAIIPSLTLAIYLPLRFIVPYLLTGATSFSIHLPLQSLLLYQILIINRIVIEVFIPSDTLLYLSNLISHTFYFHISNPFIQKESYEIFIETVGGDIAVLSLIPFFIIISTYSVWSYINRKKNSAILIFSILLIVASAFPLLFILSYAPWWKESFLIDSRHLYFPSVGASIVFAFGIINGGKILLRKIPRKLVLIIGITVLFFWVTYQYKYIQKKLIKFQEYSTARQYVLKTVEEKIPKLGKKSIILVVSDTPYYGFSNIPPFQTNLGQILMVKYFYNNDLPESFLTDAKLFSRGLTDEGYSIHDGKTFGYYITMPTLMKDLKKGKFLPDDIRSFSWNGQKNELLENTEITRTLASKFLKNYNETLNWKKIVLTQVKFDYPQGSLENVVEYDENTLNSYKVKMPEKGEIITIKIIKKDKEVTFDKYVPGLSYYDGTLIGEGTKVKNITRSDGTLMTIAYTLHGDNSRYLVPFSDSNYYMDISSNSIENIDENIEEILFTTYFN